ASGLAADRAAIAAVCTPPVKNHPLCRSTRRSEHAAIVSLRREHTAAVRLYYRTVEATRHAFWAAIHSLPGGGGIPADRPIPQRSSWPGPVGGRTSDRGAASVLRRWPRV